MKFRGFLTGLIIATIVLFAMPSRGQASQGSYGWTKRLGGTSFESGDDITTDPAGNVYVTGYFRGTVNFGADFGTTDTKTSSGSYDVFIVRINSNGTYAWVRRMGGSTGTSGEAITIDPSGNAYILGGFHDTVDFGADFGITDSKTSAGSADIFITRITMLLPIFDGHDFNGNGSADASVWRPTNGKWFIKGLAATLWGQTGDIPANGDYNGNGTTDITVWGQAGDIPVPGNYNGDVAGTTDIAVWRPSNGRWYIQGGGGAVWGNAGDIPVPADYDGDGDTDIAVWRPSNGRWYIKDIGVFLWGTLGDIPLVR